MVPQKLEQQIRLELPCVRHAVIVGDGEDYVSVLLTVQTMVEDDAASTVQSPRLTEEAARWFKVGLMERYILRLTLMPRP